MCSGNSIARVSMAALIICGYGIMSLHNREKLLKCGDCKHMHYCNRKCQVRGHHLYKLKFSVSTVKRGDWWFHKTECAGIKRIRESMPTATPSDTMLLVARLVTMARRLESKKQQLEYLSKIKKRPKCTNFFPS